MLLLLMRHGIAADLSEKYREDFDRPLTAKGRLRVELASHGLLELVPSIDFIASSPKVRARETAEIVGEIYREADLMLWPELMEDDEAALQRKLDSLQAETVLLCGHEPNLSRFASYLLTGGASGFQIEFKKSGVCALETEGPVLLWHLGAKGLRKLGS